MGVRVSWIEFVSVSDNVFLEISSNSYFQNLMRVCSVMNGITDKLSKVEITCNCNRMEKVIEEKPLVSAMGSSCHF